MLVDNHNPSPRHAPQDNPVFSSSHVTDSTSLQQSLLNSTRHRNVHHSRSFVDPIDSSDLCGPPQEAYGYPNSTPTAERSFLDDLSASEEFLFPGITFTDLSFDPSGYHVMNTDSFEVLSAGDNDPQSSRAHVVFDPVNSTTTSQQDADAVQKHIAALQGFKEDTQPPASPSQNEEPDVLTAPINMAPRKHHTVPKSRPAAVSTKRQRAKTPDSPISPDSPQTPSRPAQKQPRTTLDSSPTSASAVVGFICPYYFLDTVKYHDCYSHKLKRISDLKQHFRRRHKQKPFCLRCHEVFDDDAQLETHSKQAGRCKASTTEQPDGVTDQQISLMRAYPPARKNLAAQWYAVWDIIFPKRDRPASPFKKDHMPKSTLDLLEFCRSPQGRSILEQAKIPLEFPEHLTIMSEAWMSSRT